LDCYTGRRFVGQCSHKNSNSSTHHTDTIITSFPQRFKQDRGKLSDQDFGPAENSPDPDLEEYQRKGYIAEEIGDVLKEIMKELRNTDRRPLKTVDELAILILRKCSRLFFNSDALRHEKLKFLDFFQSRVARVVGLAFVYAGRI
jgi:hypothetical protein